MSKVIFYDLILRDKFKFDYLSRKIPKRYRNNKFRYNEELMKACESLRGYALLNDKVKEYKLAGMNVDAAASNAIRYCVENNVLSEFLKKYQEEVALMLSGIYTFEEFTKDLQDDVDELREEVGELKSENGELKSELAEKDEIIRKLQEQLKEAKNSN